MSTTAVRASVDVAVDPQTAFRIFTRDIDSWWRRGPHNFYDAKRAKAMRFEPGVGGRYLEIYDENAGDLLEIGRITVWEPGTRLVWRCSLDDTEIDIQFTPIASGTRVELEQRLVEGGSRAELYTGWDNILDWFLVSSGQDASTANVRRAIPYLCVRGAADALKFYTDAFGAVVEGSPAIFDGKIGHAALRIGDCKIFLADEAPSYGVQSPLTLGACTATVVLQVHDVDAIVERAGRAGATVTQQPVTEPYGRTAKLLDPYGQRWIVQSVSE